VTPPGPVQRLEAFLEAASSLEPACDGTPVAIGWATVELERAVAELGVALRWPAGRFAVAADDLLLGARCRVAFGSLPGGLTLLVLEPSTEGRLAASLARSGEGPAAIWLTVADLPGAIDAARTPGATLSSERAGPLGPERLLRGGSIHGPHRLLVGLPGTIRP
jgi:hypothetical protein